MGLMEQGNLAMAMMVTMKKSLGLTQLAQPERKYFQNVERENLIGAVSPNFGFQENGFYRYGS